MDLSINFKDQKKKLKLIPKIHSQKIIFYFYFKLSFSKFARDYKNLKLKPKLKPLSIFECICLLLGKVSIFWIISGDEKRNRIIFKTIWPIKLILNQKDIQGVYDKVAEIGHSFFFMKFFQYNASFFYFVFHRVFFLNFFQ